jgi:23S rRNA (cytosine1962-C5)-methyltransferase
LSVLETLVANTLAARAELIDEKHNSALRLFNGFLEGEPDLTVDLFGRSLVIYNHTDPPEGSNEKVQRAWQFYRVALPWIKAVVVKARYAPSADARRGVLVYGDELDRKVYENGVWYSLDLHLNQDASLYLDTRRLRAWAKTNLGGRRVLNTFAYTGSLGVAAQAGGADRVIQTDLSRRFLNLAKTSYTLNGFLIDKEDFIASDFWQVVSAMKRRSEMFDCVFLDPPFFSTTPGGRVDLVNQSQRVINKVRPLVSDGGWLVAINNSLFLGGHDYHNLLENLCADGYMRIEELIEVPPDCTGYPQTITAALPTDPAPFNHATKIAVLRIRRKASQESRK